MRHSVYVTLLSVLLGMGPAAYAQSFLDEYHGDIRNYAGNVHSGNLIRLTFHNNASTGGVRKDQVRLYPGEWPIGSGKAQLALGVPFISTEVRAFKGIDQASGDSLYEKVTPAIFSEGWDPNIHSHDEFGVFYGFESIPGMLNIRQKEIDPKLAVAMSHQPFTWPPFWPDKMADPLDPGWSAHWNGYFGKDQQNADQESYHIIDDYQYRKKLKGLALPLPLPTQPERGGLGLRMYVRGLQWSNPDAEDVIFWLYELENFGTLFLDRTVFGLNAQSFMGGLISGNTQTDGRSKFFRDKAMTISWDGDNVGMYGYTPVPWLGWAYLESPGNPYDGIDNDGDGNDPTKPGGGSGRVITTNDFFAFYTAGDPVVLIDYNDAHYKRTVTTMPAGGITFTVNGTTYTKLPNIPLIEVPRNGVDDNLNGLIDENDGTVFADSSVYYLYIRSDYNRRDYLAIDYIRGTGLGNALIDERRDDGIDNDGDWDPFSDDVGIDGKPGTGDEGEGDHLPTAGRGNLPGEPNVDRTDVDESDQIGLTGFKYYVYGSVTYSNDDQIWTISQPGYLDDRGDEPSKTCQFFTAGFFPLLPKVQATLSVAIVFGWDEADLIRNKDVVQSIYNSNYNFAIAPTKPKLTAVAGNKEVTLYWDDGAEKSFDRFLKEYDFEGYKVYRSTDYTFEDAGAITDGYGYDRYRKPLAIYDRIDSVYGFFPKDFGTGVLFNLGSETGLVHTFVDHDVMNGMRYYYAVTAYDRGNLEKNIGPTETTIYVNVDQAGNIQFSENVVAVTPQAPSSGFREAGFDVVPTLVGDGLTQGAVGVNIVDPDRIRDGDQYEIQFLDKSMDKRDNDLNGKVDGADANELLPTETTGFVLKHQRLGTVDTAWIYERKLMNGEMVEIQNLYDDKDGDPRTLTKVMGGLEVFVRNPEPGVYNDPSQGVYEGVRWGSSIKYETAYPLIFGAFSLAGFQPGTPYPRQYKVVFYDTIVDTSDRITLRFATTGGPYPVPRSPVNFRVYDMQTGAAVRCGFVDRSEKATLTPRGHFSAKDRIIFYEKLANDSTLITFSVLNNADEDTTFYNEYGRIIGAGDTLYLYTDNPFTSSVSYRFTVQGESIDQSAASGSLANIRVVPNPYVVSAVWEPRNPYSSGRGPRVVQFINLPQECTIRIYAVDGTLVRTLDHTSSMRDGAETWDLLSSENMDVAYGVYIYHVDAPGVGEHIGKIFVVK